MKMLFFSADGSEVEVAHRELVQAGIRCQVRNSPAREGVFQTRSSAELWVQNDADYPKAASLCVRLGVGFETRQAKRSSRLWTDADDQVLQHSCSAAG
jgi:hypothetical protein